jgi:hypothetical protein
MRGRTLAMAGEVGEVVVGDVAADVFLPMFTYE